MCVFVHLCVRAKVFRCIIDDVRLNRLNNSVKWERCSQIPMPSSHKQDDHTFIALIFCIVKTAPFLESSSTSACSIDHWTGGFLNILIVAISSKSVLKTSTGLLTYPTALPRDHAHMVLEVITFRLTIYKCWTLYRGLLSFDICQKVMTDSIGPWLQFCLGRINYPQYLMG